MEYLKLNNGVLMPKLGLGTFLIPQNKISQTIKDAYDLGYRQFDTAWKYRNEKDIAKALKSHGVNREDVFITTKVNINALYHFGHQVGKRSILNFFKKMTVKQAIQQSFKNLGGGKKEIDYIDLFLVHYPFTVYLEMYEELTCLYHQGRIRAIGVSNMLPPHIESLKEVSDVVPAINQVEISPLNTQKKLIKWCQDRDIHITAMSTFSHFRSCKPRKEIIESPLILPIAQKYNKSTVQVVLRWLIQQDIIAIPKTWNYQHLKENIDIFNFSLTDEEMKIIDSMDRGHFLNYKPFLGLLNLPPQYMIWNY